MNKQFCVVWSVSENGKVLRAGIEKTFSYRKVAQRRADELSAKYKQNAYAVMTPEEYHSAFDGKTRLVRNMMTGQMQEESVTTSWYCSVASESYWCN
jgi:hypothetical protein